jgi:ankyrin repeat protein
VITARATCTTIYVRLNAKATIAPDAMQNAALFPHWPLQFGDTALTYACWKANTPLALLIISKGADLKAHGQVSTLHGAPQSGVCIFGSRNQNARSFADLWPLTWQGRRALLWAAKNGDIDLCRQLIVKGAEVGQDSSVRAPCHLASSPRSSSRHKICVHCMPMECRPTWH